MSRNRKRRGTDAESRSAAERWMNSKDGYVHVEASTCQLERRLPQSPKNAMPSSHRRASGGELRMAADWGRLITAMFCSARLTDQ